MVIERTEETLWGLKRNTRDVPTGFEERLEYKNDAGGYLKSATDVKAKTPDDLSVTYTLRRGYSYDYMKKTYSRKAINIRSPRTWYGKRTFYSWRPAR